MAAMSEHIFTVVVTTLCCLAIPSFSQNLNIPYQSLDRILEKGGNTFQGNKPSLIDLIALLKSQSRRENEITYDDPKTEYIKLWNDLKRGQDKRKNQLNSALHNHLGGQSYTDNVILKEKPIGFTKKSSTKAGSERNLNKVSEPLLPADCGHIKFLDCEDLWSFFVSLYVEHLKEKLEGYLNDNFSPSTERCPPQFEEFKQKVNQSLATLSAEKQLSESELLVQNLHWLKVHLNVSLVSFLMEDDASQQSNFEEVMASFHELHCKLQALLPDSSQLANPEIERWFTEIEQNYRHRRIRDQAMIVYVGLFLHQIAPKMDNIVDCAENGYKEWKPEIDEALETTELWAECLGH